MRNNTLKSAILVLGSVVMLFLVVTQPRIDNLSPWHPASSEVDSIAAPAAERRPDLAGVIGKNTTFFELMLKCGLDPPMIDGIQKGVRHVYDLRRIFPNRRYEIYKDGEGNLESMQLEIDDESYLDIVMEDGTVSAEKKEYDYRTTLRTASGIIESSLYESIVGDSLPGELAHKLGEEIFAWTIDFSRINRGDCYRIIYEDKVRFDGKRRLGRILAAEFNAQGKSHYAFLFKNQAHGADYFDERGHSLRKQLLKTPLSFTRISSNFSRSRFHPVLHHYAPHYGVDYAAPAGTPVMSAGDGKVVAASRTRSNGNYVKIQHPNGYTSYYLHLQRFAKGVYAGAYVKQKQVIGYVGSTGFSTGPHLDYRLALTRTGRFVNPRSLMLPPAEPVTKANMAAFIDLRDRHLAYLTGIDIRSDEMNAVASRRAFRASEAAAERDDASGMNQAGASH